MATTLKVYVLSGTSPVMSALAFVNAIAAGGFGSGSIVESQEVV